MRRELKVDHQDGHLPRAQGRNLMRRELKAPLARGRGWKGFARESHEERIESERTLVCHCFTPSLWNLMRRELKVDFSLLRLACTTLNLMRRELKVP